MKRGSRGSRNGSSTRSTRASQVPRGESRACESEATAGRGRAHERGVRAPGVQHRASRMDSSGTKYLFLGARTEDRSSMSVMEGPSAVLKPRAGTLSKPEPLNLPMPVSKVSPGAGAAWDSESSSGSENEPEEAMVPSPAELVNVKPIKVSAGTPPLKARGGDVTAHRATHKTDAGQLRICAVTWNMCNRRFPGNLEPMLAPLFGGEGERRGWTASDDGDGTPCDVLVVGVQEAPAMDGFVELLMDALGGADDCASWCVAGTGRMDPDGSVCPARAAADGHRCAPRRCELWDR